MSRDGEGTIDWTVGIQSSLLYASASAPGHFTYSRYPTIVLAKKFDWNSFHGTISPVFLHPIPETTPVYTFST